MGLFDRHALPAEVRRSLAAALSVEAFRTPPRALAWAQTPGGAVVGLTDRLAILDAAGAWSFLPWHRLLSAAWDDAGTVLTWRTVARPHALEHVMVTHPGRLPEVVRERVEQSIVARQEVTLAPGAVGTLTGRRPLGGDGEVEWTILPARGVDLRRPEYAAASEAIIAAARRDWS